MDNVGTKYVGSLVEWVMNRYEIDKSRAFITVGRALDNLEDDIKNEIHDIINEKEDE